MGWTAQARKEREEKQKVERVLKFLHPQLPFEEVVYPPQKVLDNMEDFIVQNPGHISRLEVLELYLALQKGLKGNEAACELLSTLSELAADKIAETFFEDGGSGEFLTRYYALKK